MGVGHYTLVTMAPLDGAMSRMGSALAGGLVKRRGCLRDVLSLGHVDGTPESCALEVRAWNLLRFLPEAMQ